MVCSPGLETQEPGFGIKHQQIKASKMAARIHVVRVKKKKLETWTLEIRPNVIGILHARHLRVIPKPQSPPGVCGVTSRSLPCARGGGASTEGRRFLHSGGSPFLMWSSGGRTDRWTDRQASLSLSPNSPDPIASAFPVPGADGEQTHRVCVSTSCVKRLSSVCSLCAVPGAPSPPPVRPVASAVVGGPRRHAIPASGYRPGP